MFDKIANQNIIRDSQKRIFNILNYYVHYEKQSSNPLSIP